MKPILLPCWSLCRLHSVHRATYAPACRTVQEDSHGKCSVENQLLHAFRPP
jgi:hypothetical protein